MFHLGNEMDKTKQIRLFDRQAAQYSSRKEGQTLRRWRRNLLSHANGEVLELAVGAGANFPYYPPGVKVTATDFSREMLKKAREAAVRCRLDADFILTDIEELEFPDHSFDTIVSTLSFCSYGNPLRVLNKLRRWCKPEGIILLLEHGISSNAVVATVQRMLDPLLFRAIGCHHTRNMPDLVRQSGMLITRAESHLLKSVHLLWAKPGRQ
ncbi:2-methoxy-6-polyprenyl-1,4-benzoquinol methylase, mitochondrial [Paenibacillus sp. CECT 9249]|uniref:class I SAM-dependent methyltransferase n=1 Tax=Paenibacillus sp. CECT 9249 TaxID=2845385 RepID=UPI001E40B118|nr:class I SAM-dependent methyltransferase [Paenibacillus sp. CECT 9249]CAH0121898.1 2-methoxy-6-polyprenyl-1,4-benzoquinol methylase, mitochondrial [Paenibacillus sp. CECT 9249]